MSVREIYRSLRQPVEIWRFGLWVPAQWLDPVIEIIN